MTASLTTLISRTQAQLIDDGTRFSTATLTAAYRAVMAEVTRRYPLFSSGLMEIVSQQYEYEVTDLDPEALSVQDVLLYDDAGEEHIPLEYNQYWDDNRLHIRLKKTQSDSRELLIRYAKPQTINGLDSATESTLMDEQDQMLVDGACYHALKNRAASRVETINLQQAVSDNYREIMLAFYNAYESALALYERRKPAPSPNRQTAWNDDYHRFAE